MSKTQTINQIEQKLSGLLDQPITGEKLMMTYELNKKIIQFAGIVGDLHSYINHYVKRILRPKKINHIVPICIILITLSLWFWLSYGIFPIMTFFAIMYLVCEYFDKYCIYSESYLSKLNFIGETMQKYNLYGSRLNEASKYLLDNQFAKYKSLVRYFDIFYDELEQYDRKYVIIDFDGDDWDVLTVDNLHRSFVNIEKLILERGEKKKQY
jgi:hypothetical protein